MSDTLAIKLAVQNVQAAQAALDRVNRAIAKMQGNGARGANAQADAVNRVKRAYDAMASGARNASTANASLASSYGRVAAGIASVVAGTKTLMAAVNAFEEMSATRMGLTNMIGSAGAANALAASRRLSDISGTRASELNPQILKLAGTGEVAADQLIPTLRAFLALGKQGGARPDGINRAFEQFTQIASQGKLQGDELRSIQENGVQLRKLLKDAGLGDRIGSQTNPITFQEIQKALLAFGNSARATQALSIGSNFATAAFNRLMNVLQLDVLPVLGRALTPALVRLADRVRAFFGTLSQDRLTALGNSIGDAVFNMGAFALTALPLLTTAISTVAPIVTKLTKTFVEIDTKLNGGLMKTLIAIGALRLAGGVVGGVASAGASMAGTAAGAAAGALGGRMWAGLIKAVSNLALFLGAAAEKLPVVGTLIATFVTGLGTALSAASAGMIAAVVGVGAAIGVAIGSLINMIPGVRTAQERAGNFLHNTFGGGAEAADKAAQASPDWKPGGRLYEEWAKKRANGPTNVPATQSARRSDPMRLITEAGASGLRYAR